MTIMKLAEKRLEEVDGEDVTIAIFEKTSLPYERCRVVDNGYIMGREYLIEVREIPEPENEK